MFLGLLACKTDNPNIVAKFPEDPELKRNARAGNLFHNENGIVIFKAEKKKQSSLWNDSLQVISKTFPILTIDQKSGFIISDWGTIKSISNNDNLYKVNAIINGDDFAKENINLTVFKKLKNQQTVEDKKVEESLLNMIFDVKKYL